MERISGREAITVMAEIDLGHRKKLTKAEKMYVYRQAQSFRDWLVETQSKTLEEAKEVCRELYDKDVALLTEDDPYAEHIWSRGQEVGMMEINLAEAAGSDPEKSVNDELKEWQDFETRMEALAEKNVGKYPNEVWKLSLEKYLEIMEYLHELKDRYTGKLLTTKDNLHLLAVWRRILELRTGRSPVLMWRHYAIARNILDQIRGIRRKVLKVPIPKDTEDEGMDAHDAMELVVHGLDVERMYDK